LVRAGKDEIAVGTAVLFAMVGSFLVIIEPIIGGSVNTATLMV